MTKVGDVIGGVTVVTAPGVRGKRGDEEPCGPTYRFVTAKDAFPTIQGVETLYDSLERAVAANPDAPSLGRRPIDAQGNAGDFEWITYKELQGKPALLMSKPRTLPHMLRAPPVLQLSVAELLQATVPKSHCAGLAERVKAVGSAVVASGVQAKGKIGIYSGNTMEYMITLQAGNYFNNVVVPIYDSLGENAVEYIVEHAGVELLFMDVAKLPQFTKVVNKVGNQTKAVIYWGSGEPKEADKKTLSAASVELTSFDDFLALGHARPSKPAPAGPDDTCTIMYTSGTTGDPKGVQITHRNIVAGIAALAQYTDYIGVKVTTDDSTLSYLPLAHIFDRIVEEFALSVGAKIGYSQGNIKKITDDVAALRPTLFIAVPRVLERIQSGIAAKVAGKGLMTSIIFKAAYWFKSMRLWMGSSVESAAPWLDALIFNSVKKGFGGRIRFVVSGGAPLSAKVQEFLQITLCCPVLQGYGLTETCAASFFTLPPPMRHTGTVGPALPATEFRFQAVPEMKYDPFSSVPRGEICVRGPTVFSGYYKMPDKTAKSFDVDGFMHTGDIGELTPEGCLRIIDRLKNIFKLSQGEYIAVEKLENAYVDTDIVEAVWVYGTSTESFLVAVVVPERHRLSSWAQENSIEGSYQELCANDKVVAYVLAELSKMCKEKRLKGFEAIRGLLLRSHPFSVEDDTMTPSMKLKRPQLTKLYRKDIDKLYIDTIAKMNAR